MCVCVCVFVCVCRLDVYLGGCLDVYLGVCLGVCLGVYLDVYLGGCLDVYLGVCLAVLSDLWPGVSYASGSGSGPASQPGGRWVSGSPPSCFPGPAVAGRKRRCPGRPRGHPTATHRSISHSH